MTATLMIGARASAPCLGPQRRLPTTAMPASLADARNASRSKISVLPASIDNTVAPATRIAWIVASPTTGTSNRMSCFGLATLMIDAGAGQVTGAGDGLVGAFHRLDRDHRLVLHGDRLADVEAGNRVRHAIAELQVLALGFARRALAQLPLAGQQRLQELRRVDQLDAALAHQVGDGGDQRVGVHALEPAQQRQRGQVGHEAAEDLDVLDLPRHHRLGDVGVLENLEEGAELAERDPVHGGRRRPRGGLFELLRRFFLDGDDGDVVAHRARGVEHQERKPPVAGDQPSSMRAIFGHLVGFRRSRPHFLPPRAAG